MMDWEVLAENVVMGKSSYCLVFYEDLLKEPINELRKVMKFLEKSGFIQNNLEERLICLSENLQGNNKRKKNENERNPFTKEQTKFMNSKIDYLQNVFNKANIDVDLSSYKRRVN